ncbi:protein roadkill-like [Schistocerca nitens]|uniref:protein roadkill-like n=1 Tax=Schistocerca nitens TaxID=7011 RepID=UPI0021184630|nr:protein roadkill-like [Schistocerca nitens]
MEAVKDVTETVTVDLGALLDAGDDATVILEAGDTRLVAHRAVLADRSPVLAAMFAHDTLETSTGVVSIPDVGGPVLRQLVSYLYTLRAPQLPGTAPQLLAAADKYGASWLKAECERQVAIQLSVETAAAAAVLAVRHSCSDLRRTAIKLIKTCPFEVMATQGWADAMLHQPEDLIEVSRLLCDPPPKSRSLSAEKRARRLVQAAREGSVGELRALIAAGADVGARGGDGLTPLHWAAGRGDVEAARLLVGVGAAVNSRDVAEWTPLHLAAANGHAEVVAALLVAGADRGATTPGGETALDLARRRNQRRLVEMLS